MSITENIDYSMPQGRLITTMLAGFAEYFSDSLATHIKKGVSERAMLDVVYVDTVEEKPSGPSQLSGQSLK